MRTTYTTRRRMIMMKKQGLANDLNKRTRDIKPPPPPPPTTTRRHLALGTFIWGSVFASSSSSSLALDSECASCSDSNSSLQPGDKAFRVSNTGLRVLDVKEGKGDQASRVRLVHAHALFMYIRTWRTLTLNFFARFPLPRSSATDPGTGGRIGLVWVHGGVPGQKDRQHERNGQPVCVHAGRRPAAGHPRLRGGRARHEAGRREEGEIPGELEEALAYPVQKNARYDRGPVPFSLGGRRALDFVLDNKTLKPFNKTLLFDIRLNNIRK